MLEQMATDLAAYKVQAMQEREEDRVKQKNLQKVIDQEWRRAVEDLTEKCAKQDKEIGLLQHKCQGLDQSLKDIKRERESLRVSL
jgi:septation ring formation regulator EzrA